MNLINPLHIKTVNSKEPTVLHHPKFKGDLNAVFNEKLSFLLCVLFPLLEGIGLSRKQNLIVVFRFPVKNNNSWSTTIELQALCIIYSFAEFSFTGCKTCNRHYDFVTLDSNTAVGKSVSQKLFCQIQKIFPSTVVIKFQIKTESKNI